MSIQESSFLDYSICNALPRDIHIEMTEYQSSLVCGLLNKYKPKNIMEIGVATGGTTALILKTLEVYGLNAQLDSYDFSKNYYRDHSKPTGFQAQELFPHADNWNLITGNYLPALLENTDKKYDFVILDTVHSMPGELLDFPVLLQYAHPGTIFVLHDYQYHFSDDRGFSNAILFSCIVADKIACRDSKYPDVIPNIAACNITNDTYKYIENVFSAFTIPWIYDIGDEQYQLYRNFYSNYYSLYVPIFDYAYQRNKQLLTKRAKSKQEDSQRKLSMALHIYNDIMHTYGFANLKPIFADNYNYLYYCINSNSTIHFEFAFSGNSVNVSLHFQGADRSKSDIVDEIILHSMLKEPLKKIASPSFSGIAYHAQNYDDYKYVTLLMKYLMEISLPVLRKHGLVFYF